jgi:hypothetical protein
MKTRKYQLKMKRRRYQVLSPDGFTIDHNHSTYPGLKSARAALETWVQRYKQQGFYSTGNRTRIPFDEITFYCEII